MSTDVARHDQGGRRGDALTSDVSNAERLVAMFGDELRYVAQWKKWLVWCGTHWQIDETERIREFAKQTARTIYAEAGGAPSKDARDSLAKWAVISESGHHIRAMIDLARSDPRLVVNAGSLDADPWLLNCPNGTVDLRTGELRPHERADLITKVTAASPTDGASCPAWFAFLDRVFGGDAELISYVRSLVGYSLAGVANERILLVLYGMGANGKSTLLETCAEILGPGYAQRAPSSMFLAKSGGGIPNDIARLQGARMVIASETDEGQRLASSTIKQLTGGDTVTARYMYGEFFEFNVQATFWLATNHRPEVAGDDEAMWDRLRQIPFDVRIPVEERDPGLRARLLGEADAILAWAVEGCLSWQRDGLAVPQAVADATGDYRGEMDRLAEFFDDRIYDAPDRSAGVTEVYAAYGIWARRVGEVPLRRREFDRRLEALGYRKGRTSDRRFWRGMILRPDPDAPAVGGLDCCPHGAPPCFPCMIDFATPSTAA